MELSAKVKVYSDSSSTASSSSSDDRVILMFPTCILMVSVSTHMTYHYQVMFISCTILTMYFLEMCYYRVYKTNLKFQLNREEWPVLNCGWG